MVDYYKVLEVAEDATDDAIKKSYRRLARKYHPDVSKEQGAEEKFKNLSEAYEVLRDPDKRNEYDQQRKFGSESSNWDSAQTWGGGQHYHAGSFEDVAGASEIFESLFGRGRQQAGARQGYEFAVDGDDVHYRMPVSLEESCHGAKRQIAFDIIERDDMGEIRHRPNKLNVTIPAGVVHGQQLRLKGKGSPGISGGRAGDLYLEIEFEPHRLFHHEGRDVTMTVPVTPWEVALGETIEVPTLHGRKNLKLPANSKSGQKLRMKGQGLPGKPAGDQYVVLQVHMPAVTNDEDRDLLEKMKQQMAFDPRQEMRV